MLKESVASIAQGVVRAKGGDRGVGKGVFQGRDLLGGFPRLRTRYGHGEREATATTEEAGEEGRRERKKLFRRLFGKRKILARSCFPSASRARRKNLFTLQVSLVPHAYPLRLHANVYNALLLPFVFHTDTYISDRGQRTSLASSKWTANTLECQTQHLPTAQACPSGYAKC